MTVLSRSDRNPAMMTVQCDLCLLPLVITNSESVIVRQGWQLGTRGADFDACPACLEARDGRVPLSLRRAGNGAATAGGRLPDLLIIGAAKAGTTSLHAHLDCHPGIAMAPQKELRFFSDPQHLHWLDTYRQELASDATLVGESCTLYTRAPAIPAVPERMAALVPKAKLIYLVRDPLQRALSSYVEERFHRLEPRAADEAFADLDDPYNPYVAGSRYAAQLDRYLMHFPQEQILVVSLTELAADLPTTMRRVFEFLDVDPGAVTPQPLHLHDRSTRVEYVGAGARLRQSWVGRTVRRVPPRVRGVATRGVHRVLTRPIGDPTLSPEIHRRLEETLAPDTQWYRELTHRDVAQRS